MKFVWAMALGSFSVAVCLTACEGDKIADPGYVYSFVVQDSVTTEPIAGVQVHLGDTTTASSYVTDSSGFFEIPLFVPKQDFTFRKTGYESKVVNATVSGNSDTFVVLLTP